VQRNKEPGYLILYGDGLDSRGSIPGRSKRFFSTPQRPDRLLCSPSLFIERVPGDKWLGREADY
jgi:hypothetical protein